MSHRTGVDILGATPPPDERRPRGLSQRHRDPMPIRGVIWCILKADLEQKSAQRRSRMNRRYFLPAALGALTTARRAVAASDKINIVLMGVRGRGRGLTKAFCDQPDVN